MSAITMPRLSDSMERGTIVRWLKQEGERLIIGEELVEVETDKATVTVSVELEGLLEIVAAEGATVAPGDTIARVLEAGEQLAVAATVAPGDTIARVLETGERLAVVATPPAREQPAVAATPPAGEQPAVAATPPAREQLAGAATPLARRAAKIHGIALAHLTGTGPRGRITHADVLAAAGLEPPAAAPTSPPAPDSTPPSPAAVDARSGEGTVRRLTRLQQLIAARMSESRSTIPEFEVETEVAMDAALAFRDRLRESIRAGDPVPSLTDLIVKACALVLRGHPNLNASFADGAVHIHGRVNIGIAVATEGALIVPTITDADTRPLGAIASESRRLADRVRSGEISPAELEGGTFTVSNLGMYGMTAIRPVINPPQVAILGVGSVRTTLARAVTEIVDLRLLTLTLSCDHRAVYGADAARFLGDLRDLLEAPLRIVVS
ncbi:MAG: dihydrolipoamide acetyltransferase family protein [Solirubrobacteraceae bacterium]